MTWANTYVGIVYKDKGASFVGADCWGLVRLIYRNERHIELPSFSAYHLSSKNVIEVAETVRVATESRWPWKKVDEVCEFDVMLFRFGRLECHVGIALNDRLFLHSPHCESVIEKYQDGHWSNRLTGVYRYSDGATA